MNTAQTNMHAAELAKFDRLAARWWGEPGLDAQCNELHCAPASDRAGMPGPVQRAMDGLQRAGAQK